MTAIRYAIICAANSMRMRNEEHWQAAARIARDVIRREQISEEMRERSTPRRDKLQADLAALRSSMLHS